MFSLIRRSSFNAPASDRARPFTDLVSNIGVLEHRLGLVFVMLPLQPLLKILLVSAQDFVVSFLHLERAPFGLDRNLDNSHSTQIWRIFQVFCARS